MARHSILLSPVLRRMITKPFVKAPPGIQILAGRWEDQPLDDDDEQVERGGPGSGHFGHAGIPDHQGGSLPGNAQATGETQTAVAGIATRQSRVTHDRAFYSQIAGDAHERLTTVRKGNEEKYGWNRETNIGSRRGTTNTNPAFQWLQDRLGPGIMVYRGKGIDPSWTDSVSGRTSSALFAREEATGNEVLIAINEGQLDWHPDEIHVTHLFAVTAGTGLGTRVMEALRDYADLTQKELHVDMVANAKYFSGLGWMEPDRNYFQRLAWAHDPNSPEAQPDPRPLTFIYRPPLVSKEYVANAMASAASDNGRAEWEAGLAVRGGPGSGHHGHAGIPGHQGGSLPGETGQAGEDRPGGGTAKPTPRIVVSDRVNSHLFGVPGEKVLPEYLKAAWAKAAQDSVNRFADQTNYYPDDVLVTNDAVLFLEGSTVEDPAHEAGYLEGVILGAHNEDVGSIWMQDVRGTDFMPDSVKWHQGLYHELGHWAANKVIGKAHYEEVVPHVPITYSEPLRRNYDYDSEAVVRSEYIADLFSDYVSFQTGLAPESATGPVFRRLDSKPWTEEDVSNFQAITRVMAEAQEATRKAGGKALRQRAASATLSVLVIYNVAEEAFIMPADEAPEPVEGRVTVLPLVGSAVERGGPGSGHHGHAGIPGHQGGSLPGEGGQAEQAPEEHYGGYKIQHGTLGLAKGKVALVIPGGGNTNWHDTLDEALKQAKVWDAERQESIKLKVIRDAAVETVKAGSATNEDLRVWAGGLKEWQNAVGTDKATGMLRDLGLKAVEAKRLLYKTPSGISSGGYDIYFLEEIYAAYKRQYGPAVERFDISPVLRRLITKGGPGSGHHGHAGIPGHQGGSLPGEAGQAGEESPSSLGGRVHSEAMTAHIGAIRVTSADSDGVLDALHRNRNLYSTKTEQNEWVARGAEVWLAPSGEVFDVERSNGHARVASLALSSHYATRVDDFAPYLTLRPFTDEELMLIANRPPSERALYNHLSIEIPGRGLMDLSMSRPGKEGGLEWMWGLDLPMGQTPMNPDPIDVMKLDPSRMLGELWYPDDRDHDSEAIMAAHGFVRISRGGAAGSKTVGITWDAALSPTKAQQDVLSAAVAPIQANEDAQLVYETVNNTAAHPGAEGIARFEDDYPDFWNAIEGKTRVAQSLAVRSAMPEWALKFLIPRGGPGSGHHGHEGRPGERGGSLPGDASATGEERPQPGEMLHKWELAGLGTRPYRLVDFWTAPDRGLLEANPIAYNAAWAEHPPTTHNTFGSCEYCGTPITNHYVIQSDDKRRFCVGSECVRKTGDAGLVNALKRYEAKERQAESQERYVRQVEEGKVLLETHRAALSALPHPNEGMARSGRTLYDYYRWGIAEQHFGKSGTASGIRNIKKAVGLTSRGGEGSGHYGHAGIPGHQGGSLPGEAGQAGEEAAGTSADYLGDNASKLPGVPPSIEWHHPESEKPGADFQPLLYHGTVLDHVQDIARDGLLPQVGEWVSDAYARKLEAGEQAIPATYFSGPEDESGFPPAGRMTVTDDAYAWKSIMAIQAQVGFLMGKDKDDVTIDDIRQNGLLIGVLADDVADASLRVVIEEPGDEEDSDYVKGSWQVDPVSDNEIEVAGELLPVEALGPEVGDYFTSDRVEPSMYLYGDNLIRWMADWVQRYGPDHVTPIKNDMVADFARHLYRKWGEDLSLDDAVLDDFPGEQEDIEEESLARRVDAAVLRALSETPLPTLVSRRIFIPQWLIERGGPGSGHFGHEGIPGHQGGSMPGDGGTQKQEQETRVGITGQHSEEELGARIVPNWQLKKEMEALRGELVDAGVKGVRVEMGRGGYQGGWEQSWVLSYKGVSDAAKRILAMAAAKYGQDSFVVFEPPTEGNSHAATNLSLDVDGMDATVVANIEARLTEHKFSGWTWSNMDGKPRLQLNVVPEFGGDDRKHPAMVSALETDLKELGIRYQRDDWRAAVTAVGPGVNVEYQAYLESLRGKSLTGYRQGYIMEGRKGVGHGKLEGVGGARASGVGGESVARGTGEVRRVAGVASEGVAQPRAVGRQPGDSHSQVGLRAGVTISRVLRLVRRGGPGSGHFGHAGIPQHRGGSLPGAGPTKEELQRASRFYDKRKTDYHSRFDAMVARQKAIGEKALAHARPDVEGLKGDWSKAVALRLLEGPPYSGNVKALVADFSRFAAGTLAWLRKEKPSDRTIGVYTNQAIGTLEHIKAAMEYWMRVDEPDRALESAASFVVYDLPMFTSPGSTPAGMLTMIDENGNVNLTHPAVVKMMEAGGVREQAITRLLGVAQEYTAERSAYLQADAEMNRGTAEVDAFFERAPQVMADVSPVGMSVAAATSPKVALDTALGTQETTRIAYHDAIHALTLADQDKAMPREDVDRTAEACDYALEAYQNAQRDVAKLNIVGHDEAKEIVNAALLTADAANVEVLLDASTSMLWTAGQRDAQRLYAREAQTWLTEHADASIFPSTEPMLVTVKNTDSDVDSRASYSNNNINGKAGMDTATYLHELGHWVEDHNEGIHESAVAFLRSRTAGESTQPLRKVTGDWGYDPWELTRKDEFSSAYVGKIYGQSYTATEVVSMGIQRLYQNPSYFQREDPEHFDFTVALLRGLWNKPTP